MVNKEQKFISAELKFFNNINGILFMYGQKENQSSRKQNIPKIQSNK